MRGYYRGKGPRSYNGLWAPYGKFDHVRGEDVGAKRAPSPILVDRETFKGRSKEKCLLGRDEYGSKHALCLLEGPTPTDISNKDKSYRPVAKKET